MTTIEQKEKENKIVALCRWQESEAGSALCSEPSLHAVFLKQKPAEPGLLTR